MKEEFRLPRYAMCFGAEGELQEGGKVEMKVSSGQSFRHPYWRSLTLDLGGMAIAKDRLPILWGHDPQKILGYFNRDDVDVSDAIYISGHLVDSEPAKEFTQLAKSGTPFEASLYGQPSEIERLSEGQETEVNGNPVVGPGHVWRRWTLREAGPSVFGYDSNTSANVFSFAGSQDKEAIDIEISEDDHWLKEMLSFASGNEPEKTQLGDSEDDAAVKEMLKLARDPAGNL